MQFTSQLRFLFSFLTDTDPPVWRTIRYAHYSLVYRPYAAVRKNGAVVNGHIVHVLANLLLKAAFLASWLLYTRLDTSHRHGSSCQNWISVSTSFSDSLRLRAAGPLRTVSVALAPLVCYSIGAAARPDHHVVANSALIGCNTKILAEIFDMFNFMIMSLQVLATTCNSCSEALLFYFTAARPYNCNKIK